MVVRMKSEAKAREHQGYENKLGEEIQESTSQNSRSHHETFHDYISNDFQCRLSTALIHFFRLAPEDDSLSFESHIKH